MKLCSDILYRNLFMLKNCAPIVDDYSNYFQSQVGSETTVNQLCD